MLCLWRKKTHKSCMLLLQSSRLPVSNFEIYFKTFFTRCVVFYVIFFIDMLWRLYRVSINLDIASIVSPVIPITEMFFILPLSCCLKPLFLWNRGEKSKVFSMELVHITSSWYCSLPDSLAFHVFLWLKNFCWSADLVRSNLAWLLAILAG